MLLLTLSQSRPTIAVAVIHTNKIGNDTHKAIGTKLTLFKYFEQELL